MLRRIVIFVVAALVLWIFLYATANRSGLGYFSPQTLEYCTQTESTIPMLGIPVYRSRCYYHKNEIIEFLIENGYVKPDRESTAHWKTVFHCSDRWKDGYGPLYYMLFRHREAMIDWTLSHPEPAKVYWHELFWLLRSPDPDVMNGADSLARVWREFDTAEEVRETVFSIENELARE